MAGWPTLKKEYFMKKQFLFTTASLLLCFINSCGDTKKIDFPSFSVKPLEGSSINTFPLQEEFSQATISCEQELAFANAAPQMLRANSGKEFVEAFYAQANFYDCNARQQALEDSGDLEVAQDSPVTTVLYVGSDIPENFTRFVSWTGGIESTNNSGKLVNLYLQDDGVRTKTRIDFVNRSGLKTVNSLLIALGGTRAGQWTRSFFQEFEDGNVISHYVGGRHYDTDEQTISIVLAHMKPNAGASTFTIQCTSISPENFNTGCSNLRGAQYYDATGNSINNAQAQTLGLITDPNDIVSNTGIDLGSFYEGTEAEYFRPFFRP